MTDGPLIVQSDKTLLLEVDHPAAAEAARGHRAVRRARALPRARPHLPDHPAGAVERARRRARRRAGRRRAGPLVPLPGAAGAAGRRRRHDGPLRPAAADPPPAHGLVLVSLDRAVLEEMLRHKKIAPMLGRADRPTTRCIVHPSERGHLKQALLKVGWPAEDVAGYVDGEAHPIELDEDDWTLRDYQRQAVEGFWAGGSGVVVLPCGAGKTLVGAAAMAKAQATTLILVTNTVAGRQWRRELLARTSLTEEEIGEYSGERKEIRPVTIATYQVMTRKSEGRVQAPRPVRLPRLGPGHLRRGAPAAGAGVPDDRRPAVPPAARADRHPGPRGRPGGRRLLADRPEAVRRARGRTSSSRAGSRRPSAPRSG